MSRRFSKRAVIEAVTEEEPNPVVISSKKSKAAKGEDVALEESATLSSKGPHLRDVVKPIDLSSYPRALKVMSWNVNGLKALVTTKKDTLDRLIKNHSPDILCLQETKIQEDMVEEYRNLLPGYTSFWSCSTVKKGYSGTAIFVKRASVVTLSTGSTAVTSGEPATDSVKKASKQKKISTFFAAPSSTSSAPTATDTEAPAVPTTGPLDTTEDQRQLTTLRHVHLDFENMERFFAGEGRTIVLETDAFFLINCYVPNSGEGLARLGFRVQDWDPFVRRYLDHLRKQKPVIFTGDLNVGHLDLDIHNPDAKHIVKQAGLTPQERHSFSTMLSDGKFKDAFRFFYPTARGQFTYWSQRTFARPVNKGIRLDYFICSEDMFPQVSEETSTAAVVESGVTAVSAIRTSTIENDTTRKNPLTLLDCYILPDDTVGSSDHCPVVLVVNM